MIGHETKYALDQKADSWELHNLKNEISSLKNEISSVKDTAERGRSEISYLKETLRALIQHMMEVITNRDEHTVGDIEAELVDLIQRL